MVVGYGTSVVLDVVVVGYVTVVSGGGAMGVLVVSGGGITVGLVVPWVGVISGVEVWMVTPAARQRLYAAATAAVDVRLGLELFC